MTGENRSTPAAAASPLLPLPAEINAATRTVHTTLNRLITSRLPLSLPPHAASPRLYAFGLLHFAHVYLTFESAWHDITRAPAHANPALSSLLEDPWISVSTPPPTDTDKADDHTSGVASSQTEAALRPIDPRMRDFLARLLPPGLARSKRLRRDLAALLDLSPVEIDVQLSQYPGARIREYAAHIRRAVRERPHVLVAYAWVMYMAVFSGGRWIRAQLAHAGPDFWTRGEALAFFHFDGAADGEDIKAEFKRRLLEADALFSPEQRADVVDEAQHIFAFSALLVHELDEMLDTPMTEKQETTTTHGGEKKTSGKAAGDADIVAPPKRPAPRKHHSSSWIRQGGIAGAVVVLGGVYWWAVCCMNTAMREGWHDGWAGAGI